MYIKLTNKKKNLQITSNLKTFRKKFGTIKETRGGTKDEIK